MKLLKSWDEQERKAATRIAGLICAALTIFIFIAGVSYLFNWQEDMSLIQNPDAMSADQKVGNAAGKLGFKVGHLLVWTTTLTTWLIPNMTGKPSAISLSARASASNARSGQHR